MKMSSETSSEYLLGTLLIFSYCLYIFSITYSVKHRTTHNLFFIKLFYTEEQSDDNSNLRELNFIFTSMFFWKERSDFILCNLFDKNYDVDQFLVHKVSMDLRSDYKVSPISCARVLTHFPSL